MFQPLEAIATSTLENKFQINGNLTIVHELENLSLKYAIDDISLYDAQEKIKQYLSEKYSSEWYDKSAEAVQFIIEEKYSKIERERTSAEFYKKHAGELY